MSSILQNWVIISSWYQPLSHANLHKMWHENLCKFSSCSRLQLISHQQRNSMEFLQVEIRVGEASWPSVFPSELNNVAACRSLQWVVLQLLQLYCSVIWCFYQLWQLQSHACCSIIILKIISFFVSLCIKFKSLDEGLLSIWEPYQQTTNQWFNFNNIISCVYLLWI